MWVPAAGCYYAVRQRLVSEDSSWPTVILMHRQILGIKRGRKIQGDHKEPMATLDNRRKNLRYASEEDQQRNKHKMRTNTSGYKGVSQKGRLFRAQGRLNGKVVWLGMRTTAEAAWRELYVPFIEKNHGEFARSE